MNRHQIEHTMSDEDNNQIPESNADSETEKSSSQQIDKTQDFDRSKTTKNYGINQRARRKLIERAREIAYEEEKIWCAP